MSSEPASSLKPISKDDTTMAEPSSSSSSSQSLITVTPMPEPSTSSKPVTTEDTTMAEPSSSSKPVTTKESTKDPAMLAGPSSSSEPVTTDSTAMTTEPSSSPNPVIIEDSTMLAGPSSSAEPDTKDLIMLAGPSSSSNAIIIKDSTTMTGPSSSSKAVEGPSSSSSREPLRRKSLIVHGPGGPKVDRKAKGKEKVTFDFLFTLKPSMKLRHCIGALSNHKFNPSRMGLLEVDELSLSITVHSVSRSEPGCEEEHVFGFLNLEFDFFDYFECKHPVTKMIDLEVVLVCLSIGHNNSVLSVYSVHGSNEVTFEYDRDAKDRVPGTPSVVDLVDAMPDYKGFPQVTFEFESSVPSILLRALVEQIMQQEPSKQPDYISIQMHPAKVQLIVGDYTVDSTTEKEEVWLNWPFWETLRRATFTSDRCEIYMVTEPEERIMLMFKMSDPGDMISFNKGTFFCDQHVSCLAFLHSLT